MDLRNRYKSQQQNSKYQTQETNLNQILLKERQPGASRNSFPKDNDEPLRTLPLHVNADHHVPLLPATPFNSSRRLIPTKSKANKTISPLRTTKTHRKPSKSHYEP
ncbi:hypothetical protein GmHk_19G055945 [Glycine max]|nr:hypothetical protein GmHk_19G055945 [Glycine max]